MSYLEEITNLISISEKISEKFVPKYSKISNDLNDLVEKQMKSSREILRLYYEFLIFEKEDYNSAKQWAKKVLTDLEPLESNYSAAFGQVMALESRINGKKLIFDRQKHNDLTELLIEIFYEKGRLFYLFSVLTSRMRETAHDIIFKKSKTKYDKQNLKNYESMLRIMNQIGGRLKDLHLKFIINSNS